MKTVWQTGKDPLAKYPEARAFLEARQRWHKAKEETCRLESLFEAARQREQNLEREMLAAKARLPQEARKALG